MIKSCAVLIPTWNRGDYLLRAVKSAVEQGDYVSEIIVVDNSSDPFFQNYLTLVKRLSPKVRVYCQSVNVGATGNWLSGLRKVKTEWVKILFSDDFLLPDCLEKMFKFQDEYSLDVLVCSAVGLVNGATYDFYEHRRLITQGLSGITNKVADRVFPVSPTAALLKTNDAIRELEGMLSKQKLLKSAIGPDLVLIYGPVARGGRFGFLDERLVTMFGDGQNISSVHAELLSGYYAEAFLHLSTTYHLYINLRLRIRLSYRVIRSAISTRKVLKIKPVGCFL